MKSRTRTIVRRVAYTVVWFGFALSLSGCGDSGLKVYSVKGKVVYSDGSPMKEGTIEFEALEGEWKGRNARGRIDEDGGFELTTVQPGDGAVAGRHRAIVREPFRDVDVLEGEVMPKPIIDPRFARYQTAGLEFTVQEGENDIQINVTRPGVR